MSLGAVFIHIQRSADRYPDPRCSKWYSCIAEAKKLRGKAKKAKKTKKAKSGETIGGPRLAIVSPDFAFFAFFCFFCFSSKDLASKLKSPCICKVLACFL